MARILTVSAASRRDSRRGRRSCIRAGYISPLHFPEQGIGNSAPITGITINEYSSSSFNQCISVCRKLFSITACAHKQQTNYPEDADLNLETIN